MSQGHASRADDFGHACITAHAVHADGLLGRLVALAAVFPVISFSYRRSTDQVHARVDVCMEATEWQVQRLMHKFSRTVGIVEVVTRA